MAAAAILRKTYQPSHRKRFEEGIDDELGRMIKMILMVNEQIINVYVSVKTRRRCSASAN